MIRSSVGMWRRSLVTRNLHQGRILLAAEPPAKKSTAVESSPPQGETSTQLQRPLKQSLTKNRTWSSMVGIDYLAKQLISDRGEFRLKWMKRILGVNSRFTKNRLRNIRVWTDVQDLCQGPRLAAALKISRDQQQQFLVWWELAGLHVWLLVRRTRIGNPKEKQISDAVNDQLWDEVEARLYEEEGMSYMQLSKWSKELRKTWYARSLLLDGAVENRDLAEIENILLRNFTYCQGEQQKASLLRAYVVNELERLQEISIEDSLDGKIWETNPYIGETSSHRVRLAA